MVVVFHLHHLPTNRALPVLTFQHFADITVYRAYLKLDLSALEVFLPFDIEWIGFSLTLIWRCCLITCATFMRLFPDALSLNIHWWPSCSPK